LVVSFILLSPIIRSNNPTSVSSIPTWWAILVFHKRFGNHPAAEYNQIPYGRTHTVDRDGQGSGLSGQVESKDFGLGARPVAETIRPERTSRL
jgi:hypothetical protein